MYSMSYLDLKETGCQGARSLAVMRVACAR